MKKSLLLSLVAVGAFALTGCAKEVTKEEAKEHIKTNYTSKEGRKATVKVESKIEKATGIFEELVKGGEDEENREYETEVFPIGVSAVESLPDNYVIKLDGKKLIFILDLDGKEALEEYMGKGEIPEDAEFEADVYEKEVYNEEGYQESTESDVHLKVKYTLMGVTIEGELKASGEASFTY